VVVATKALVLVPKSAVDVNEKIRKNQEKCCWNAGSLFPAERKEELAVK